MPASSVGSSPGFTARWMAACCAVSVRRGSITITSSPRCTSARRCDERVRTRQLDPFDQERLQRIGADEQHDVGLLDPVVPALPVAVQRAGHRLGGLVDGDGRVEGRGADAVQPAQPERERHVRPRLRAVVERDGPRPVLGDDVLQRRRDLVHRRLARRSPRTSRRVARRSGGAQPIRLVVLLRQLSALLAGEALGDRVVAVAPHREHVVVGHVDLDPAVRMAEPADRRVRHGPGHAHPPARFGYVMQSRCTWYRCRADVGG